MTSQSRLTSFLIVTVLALILYLPLLSQNYDLNGLGEAAALRAGRPGDLFTPNHMLYRPLAHKIQQTLSAIGWTPGIVPFLQVLSAIFGALAIGFAYLTLTRLASNRQIAFWVSLLLAVSWSQWTLSTDVYYFSLSAMFVAAAMAVFVHAESVWGFVGCGILAGLAILSCQANVFLLPGLALALLFRDPDRQMGRIVLRAGFLWAAALALVGGVFLAVGVWVYDRHTTAALMEWGSSYSSNPLPMWGAWTPSRVLLTAGSAFKSVIGTEVWMFRFFHRFLRNGEVPAWFGPAAFVAVVAALIVAYRMGKPEKKNDGYVLLSLLLLYCAYLPFIVWWEPMEPRWFIMPNIFLAGVVAVVASRWSTSPFLKFALPALLVIVGGFNLLTSAAPRRLTPSVPTQTAACVASHMKEGDLFLATEWNWAGYVEFVHNRSVMNFIIEEARTGDKQRAMADVSKAVGDRQRQGSDVYMMDIGVYTPDYMKWLVEQTGLTADDLSKYSGDPAFECVYGKFFRLRKTDGV